MSAEAPPLQSERAGRPADGDPPVPADKQDSHEWWPARRPVGLATDERQEHVRLGDLHVSATMQRRTSDHAGQDEAVELLLDRSLGEGSGVGDLCRWEPAVWRCSKSP